jgi:serine/threonine protein phosphatase PrpC
VSRATALLEKRGDGLVGPSPAARPPLSLVAHGETDRGAVRETNEDAFAVAAHLGLFMVADGMGGAAAGEIAARAVIDQVHRAVDDGDTTWPMDTGINTPESGPRRFVAGIHRANRHIYRQALEDQRLRGMGTTFAGVLLLGRTAVVAHVGDSRVYRLRDGELERLTRDHSWVNLLVSRGHIGAAEAASHPQRNVITRAVGTRETVEVEIRIVDLRPGDAFLLCSDGLHGELDDAEIAAVLCDHPGPVAAVGRLLDRAIQKGGADNVTAVLVRMDRAPAQAPPG